MVNDVKSIVKELLRGELELAGRLLKFRGPEKEDSEGCCC